MSENQPDRDRPQPLDYVSRDVRMHCDVNPTRYDVILVASLGLLAIVFLILLRAFYNPHPHALHVQCRTNISQQLAAIFYYANSNLGALPPSVMGASQKGIRSDGLERHLICPMSGEPYIYLGAGMVFRNMPSSTIILHDAAAVARPGNSAVSEMYFAYADGSIRAVEMPRAAKILAELKTGHNPPRPEMIK